MISIPAALVMLMMVAGLEGPTNEMKNWVMIACL
jgi:hypothetical protein